MFISGTSHARRKQRPISHLTTCGKVFEYAWVKLYTCSQLTSSSKPGGLLQWDEYDSRHFATITKIAGQPAPGLVELEKILTRNKPLRWVAHFYLSLAAICKSLDHVWASSLTHFSTAGSTTFPQSLRRPGYISKPWTFVRTSCGWGE